MPILALEEVTKYMQLRKGVRYVEEVGELAGAFEIGPFSYTRIDEEQVKIVGRKLETFLGSGVKEFNPVSVVQSIYGSAAVQGDALKTHLSPSWWLCTSSSCWAKHSATASSPQSATMQVLKPLSCTTASKPSLMRRFWPATLQQARATSSRLQP